jgi:hypothetical protein
MALAKAHEGYEYQDLLTAYFILKEILEENESEFAIDKKEFEGDRIDDLLIKNKNGYFKKQIKYSGESDHTFQKSDIAADSAYGIALDKLYENWRLHPRGILTEFRLCLAWNAPSDKLRDFIEPVSGNQSFPEFLTTTFKIKGKAIWPDGQALPVSTWRRFRGQAGKIDRGTFLEFCDQLLIETTLPKFSLSLNMPGELESLVIQQVKKLGIGIFPNDHVKPDHFILFLTSLIKRARSKDLTLNTKSIFHELNIRTDYGTIEQNFPIVLSENIERKEALEEIISQTEVHGKIILVGEPGSGKSWLIENLQRLLKQKGIQSVRHYCYTKLDDLLQKERIQLNVFYGNLIHDILQAFPALKKVKHEKYASSLSELNLLLNNITHPTYLIVDGLDHIERIFNYRSYTELSRQDIAIIETLESLSVSPNLKVIITSQNISQLEVISSFHKIIIPAWTEEDVKGLLRKVKIKNRLIRKGEYLSKTLFEKSNGNPLYLKYLSDEIRKNTVNLYEFIKNLPAYSYNLSEYYQYLLVHMNMREDVPQVLAGVNFSLTKVELAEITDSGDHVRQSLQVLSPVLKTNFSQSGYIVYHESFRRFIIERLRSASVSVEKKVFQPIIDWFEKKDFYVFRKAYRYYLQFLFESGQFEKMLLNLRPSFVVDSIINGQPWDQIEKNYKYFVKAACLRKDLSKIILLNEIDKVIATTWDNLSNDFDLYCEALGRIYGFNHVSEYLLFEGNPAVDVSNGLKACYTCDEQGVPAPWSQYMSLIKSGDKIEDNDLKYFIRGMLILQQEDQLIKMLERARKSKHLLFQDHCYNEMKGSWNQDFIKSLIRKYPAVKNLLQKKRVKAEATKPELVKMADEILKIDHSLTRETELLEKFFIAFRKYARDKDLLKLLINRFKARNWFYNWIIFCLKIIVLKSSKKASYYSVKEAFDFLQYSTEPFLGKPRVADLHSAHYLIYESLQEGLSLIKTEEQWKEIIDLLVKVGNETTVTFQRSPWGPLETSTLFKLLGECVSDKNREYINKVFEELTEEREGYRLHGDIAEYNLRLASLFSSARDREKAIRYFQKGIECMFAYTMRKDLTLWDVIEGVEWMANIFPDEALDELKMAKILVESAVDHTDGKETHYFPVLWFERFINIDFKKASLYLLDDLKRARHNWIAEKGLVNLLSVANGKISPIVESLIAFTFPCVDSEKFIQYCVHLHSLMKKEYPVSAGKLAARIIAGVQPRQHRSFSSKLTERINNIIREYNKEFTIPFENEARFPFNKKWHERQFVSRKEFSLMNIEELINYFETNGIRKEEFNSLCYFLDQFSVVTDPVKELIRTINGKNNKEYSEKLDIDTIFETGNEIECYYWVCRFSGDTGGHFERFVNQQAFKKAININKDKAIEFLFELLPSTLDIQFNFVFSSNLIRALSDNGYDKAVVKEMWENTKIMSSYRLPFKDSIEWESRFEDDLGMTQYELLICMLICRLKASTTERFQHVTISLQYLLEKNPEKLVKPFKWFFANRELFLRPVLAVILQLLADHKKKDATYHLQFENEITIFFPTHYFLIDFLIVRLYDMSFPNIRLPRGIVYPEIDPKDFDYLLHLNKRFPIIQDVGIDLEPVFSKYEAGFQRKYDDVFEIYQNRSHHHIVSHISSGDFLFEIINMDLYNHLISWEKGEDPGIFAYATSFDIESMAAYGNSFTIRPTDLAKPHEFTNRYTIIENILEQTSGWIRLAHYEKALGDSHALRVKPVNSMGAMYFSDSAEEIVPYSSYRTYPYHIWGTIVPDFEYEPTIVFAIFQEDTIEYYKLLWLNPTVMKALNLTARNTESGLIGVNENGETVLKMRTWKMDYAGDSMWSGIDFEFPKLEGTDLIIRSDYLQRIASNFNGRPSYRTLIIEGKSRAD